MNTLLWKRLGGDFTGRKRGRAVYWTIKVCRYRHQKTKLKIKFNLYLSDFYHQRINKHVTWRLKSQKFYVSFTCNPMEPFISGVRPKISNITFAILPFNLWLPSIYFSWWNQQNFILSVRRGRGCQMLKRVGLSNNQWGLKCWMEKGLKMPKRTSYYANLPHTAPHK